MKRIHYIFTILLLIGYLGIYQGKIAFWKDADTAPAVIFPYQADVLPYEDQQALKNKIPIQNQKELQKLIEDYLS